MNILTNLSSNQKHFLEDVIDFHKRAMQNFDIDPLTTYPVLGVFLQESFYDGNYAVKPCKYNNELYLDIKFFNESQEKLGIGDQLRLNQTMAAVIQMKFIERLIFIRQLWENGLIYFVGNLNANIPNYSYTENDKSYHEKMNISALLSPLEAPEYFNFLNKYNMAQIIPSDYLIDFCSNSFTTLEQRQYKEQHDINTVALKRAKYANIIAIIIAVVSMIVSIVCAVSIPVTISDSQHKEIIEILKTNYNEQTQNAKP